MISVVIPLYNKELSIASTIHCVLAQTYGDFELIIVNDGSRDRSPEIVQSLLPTDARIRLIDKANGGVSSARNEGIRHAQGDYVAFLDADDYWEPDYLATQVQMISEFPAASIWCTGYGHMNGSVKTPIIMRGVSTGERGYIDDYFSRFLYLIWTGVVVVRKDIFKEVNLFDERISIGEDIDLWWRLLLRGRLAFLNECKAYYRQDSENRLSNTLPPFHKHFAYYIEKYEPYYALNSAFKRYAQRELLMHMYPYFLADKQDKDIQRVLRQIDFSLQTPSYRLRYKYPLLYRLLLYTGLKK